MAGTVRLKVISPSVRLPEEERRVALDTTVAELKQQVLSSLPNPDQLADVRLLYGGKILQDGEPLSRILTQRPAPDCEVFTIHLSCSPAPAPAPAPGGTRTQEERGPGVSSPQQQWPGDGLYYTDVNQLAVMQEMYAQYLAHYYHYINTLATPPPPAPDHRQEPAPAPAPAAAPQVAQVMNAGGGGAMEEEAGRAGAERDALDWMYLSSRVVLLLSIVYFYSSLGRFVLVACIAGLVYLYQIGYFGGVRYHRRIRDRDRRLEERRERFRERVRDFRERIRLMQQNNVNNGHEAGAGNVPAGDGENQIQEAVTEEEIRSVRNDQEETAPPASTWAVASNFVFMFFASLFPETQQVT